MTTPTSSASDFTKDPDAKLDYTWDWSLWLPNGDTILTSAFTPSPGITVNSSSNTTTNSTVWLSGGTEGQSYTVTNEITTVQGRIDDRTITIRIQER